MFRSAIGIVLNVPTLIINHLTDSKGHPYGYGCLKYGDRVFKDKFTSRKRFRKGDDYKTAVKLTAGECVSVGTYPKR